MASRDPFDERFRPVLYLIYKTIRSQSPYRKQTREYLHIIQSTNLEGLMIYTIGKLVQESGIETYYFLISSKKAV